MTEINNHLRSSQQAQQQAQTLQQELQSLQVHGKRPGEHTADQNPAAADRITGLASGMNTDKIISKLLKVQEREEKPIKEQKQTTLKELRAFGLINQGLKNIKGTADKLKGSSIWEGKIVESSDDKVVTATATAGAKPGKNTLIVDRLALNHQIASQGYEAQDKQVGTGKFIITVGKGSPVTVVIDQSNNTLTGLKDAINTATKEVSATIIKTGNRKAPYQLVLTSQKTGSEGRIHLKEELKGGITPNFQNSVDAPSPWKGVGPAKPAELPKNAKNTGASTAIVRVIGDYTGKHDNTYTFTAVQSGSVGGQKQLQMRWQDQYGHSGLINLDALHYAPGKPIEFVDGLALIFSEGDVIVNDSFSFHARAQRSNLVWWVSPEDRKASVSRPTAWHRQTTESHGAPVIGGTYSGSDDEDFTLTVKGSGQVGHSRDLEIYWKSEGGDRPESGLLNVGQGYDPGTPLAITQGLTLTLKPGVLTDGQKATFHTTAATTSSRWWLPDEDRRIPSKVGEVSNWQTPGGKKAASGYMPELPAGGGPRVSTSKVTIRGKYTGDEGKVYTFTADGDGAIGTTKGLKIKWDDSKGHSGELSVGEHYPPGKPLPFAEGLSVAFGGGRVFKGDSFTVRTRTATIQPPQDAEIRFGATALGGGLPITSPTNELDKVIEGVHLNLLQASKKPITITVRGDTETAYKSVKTFVDEYNDIALLIAELTKYNKNKNVSGPLLGNQDVANIQNSLASIVTDPVAGLPRASNMLMSLGVTFNDQGDLKLDDSKLKSKIHQDFANVANLFRNRGHSDNSNVAFVGMTDATKVSPDGYAVNIEKPATQGYYETPVMRGSIVMTEQNNRFVVNVDGRKSDQLTIKPGTYSLSNYASALQDAITNDKTVGHAGVRVDTEHNRIKVISGRFGKSSSISFTPIEPDGRVGPGLMQGESQVGQDVEGTIDGTPAIGMGELLRAPDKSGPASGMRLLVTLTPSQLNPNGPEATVKVTRGVAARMDTYLTHLVDPQTGDMRRITEGLREQVSNLDGQLKRMDERIQSKRERLQARFAKMEATLAGLKEQQAYMQSQLGGMGGGASVPGLPGLTRKH